MSIDVIVDFLNGFEQLIRLLKLRSTNHHLQNTNINHFVIYAKYFLITNQPSWVKQLRITLHDSVVGSSIPVNINNFDVPTAFYNLDKPIHIKIFNFDAFVSKFVVHLFLQDNTILLCNCGRPEYIDWHYKHILTGNRKIIRDKTIKKPFVMGPKHRESKTLYFEKVKLDIADLN